MFINKWCQFEHLQESLNKINQGYDLTIHSTNNVLKAFNRVLKRKYFNWTKSTISQFLSSACEIIKEEISTKKPCMKKPEYNEMKFLYSEKKISFF